MSMLVMSMLVMSMLVMSMLVMVRVKRNICADKLTGRLGQYTREEEESRAINQ
jgi:hypothetical protein